MSDIDPAELISAYLDGELTDAEVAATEDWLGQDPAHRQLLADLTEVRRRVRDLPMLDPPPVVAAMLAAPSSPLGGRRRVRTALSARPSRASGTSRHGAGGRRGLGRALTGAAVGAVALVALMLTGGTMAVAQQIPVGTVVDAYEGRDGQWSPPEEAPQVVDSATAPDQVPPQFQLRSVAVLPNGLIGLRYAYGDTWFSVFEQQGRIAWPELGEHPGRRLTMGGDPAWAGRIYGHEVVLVERGERVYMVIGQSGQVTRSVSGEMSGDGGPTLWERIGRRCNDTVQLLGLRD